MKSLLVIWFLVLVTLILGFWWMNKQIDQDIHKSVLNSPYVCCVGDFDLHVTNGPDLIPISEPSDIQPALGYKFVQPTNEAVLQAQDRCLQGGQ